MRRARTFQLLVVMSIFLEGLICGDIVFAASTFNGTWKLVRCEKTEAGRTNTLECQEKTLKISMSENELILDGGFIPGTFPFSDDWKEAEGKKIKTQLNEEPQSIIRFMKWKEEGKTNQIFEIRTLESSGRILKVARFYSTKPGMLKSILGVGMPDEDYDFKITETYQKVLVFDSGQ